MRLLVQELGMSGQAEQGGENKMGEEQNVMEYLDGEKIRLFFGGFPVKNFTLGELVREVVMCHIGKLKVDNAYHEHDSDPDRAAMNQVFDQRLNETYSELNRREEEYRRR